MDRRQVVRGTVFALFIAFFVLTSGAVLAAPGEWDASYGRVVTGPDGRVHVFYLGRPDENGRPTAFVRADLLDNGSWVEEVVLEKPSLLPSGEWFVVIVGDGHYLLAESAPRALTFHGLTPSEMEWGMVVVPTFIEIKPLRMSDADRERTGVKKKYSVGLVSPNPYARGDNGAEVTGLSLNNDTIIVTTSNSIDEAITGKWVKLSEPTRGLDLEGARAVRTGGEIAVFKKVETPEGSRLERSALSKEGTLENPVTLPFGFDVEEFSVTSRDGKTVLVYVEKTADGKFRVVVRVSMDGGKTWSEPRAIEEGGGPFTGVDAAVGLNGAVQVSWNDSEKGRTVCRKVEEQGAG